MIELAVGVPDEVLAITTLIKAMLIDIIKGEPQIKLERKRPRRHDRPASSHHLTLRTVLYWPEQSMIKDGDGLIEQIDSVADV